MRTTKTKYNDNFIDDHSGIARLGPIADAIRDSGRNRTMPNTAIIRKKSTTTNNNRNKGDNTIFVARHKALHAYCLEQGLITRDTPSYFKRVPIRTIKGKDVIGVLSMELASFTNSYTEIPLHGCHVEPGLELDIEDIRIGAGAPRKYQVRKVS